MMTLMGSRCIWLGLILLALGCSRSVEFDSAEDPALRIRWERGGEHRIHVDGEAVGQLTPMRPGWRLTGDGVDAELRVALNSQGDGHRYPLRVVTRGSLNRVALFENAYTLLAPPAPLPVEGYGLVVSSDEPGTNDEEHGALQAWLAEQGLPLDARPFQGVHERGTGRELRVWYEISGRRVDTRFSRVDTGEALARMDSVFRSEDGGLKIHHKRPGENGRFRYHRQSLELASAIRSTSGPPLVSHECGCYGYAIAADYMTLGPALYQVEADWQDDRVAAEFFIGFEARDAFPWIGLGDRRRMRNLARRTHAYLLRDAEGRPFAEIHLDLPEDPPAHALGPIRYAIDRVDDAGTRSVSARIRHDPESVEISLFGADGPTVLAELDRLLAAMPTQIVRGDGFRDSHLDEIERLVDAVRLLRHPGEAQFADFVSDVDAWSAAGKVEALLSVESARFTAVAGARPPDPIAGPGAMQQARQTRHTQPARGTRNR
jgi:hypothetical protein